MAISFYIAPPAVGALCAENVFREFGPMPYVDSLDTSPRIEVDFRMSPPPTRFARLAYLKRFYQEYTAPFEYHRTPLSGIAPPEGFEQGAFRKVTKLASDHPTRPPLPVWMLYAPTQALHKALGV